ncbi:hypothetical protein C3747_59g132 [Trypanosoma cruzi]|uniref:Uncharacterized protein n=2 Tax=Trypanosoma cruzi TaxID=5693 RepID=Q4CU34_TRYCC|nr:hypothetical protein Tc00.1047053511573.20 [Trypanosoma cruzi]EAN83783.1 hypothetical protein Tc00.1047053511573.20 [Trypanosoma cruzi]PWV11489.1 hypothetical protein C3747_59g132 [Trypanosoma cruzi]RNC53775.1 hypothetical protein TcCL_ESM08864 [Trypanosoma cruzi]|eukprot:XP_805634.1 hypothetical protein [Trypanosoma cruzi strain CL Brener]
MELDDILGDNPPEAVDLMDIDDILGDPPAAGTQNTNPAAPASAPNESLIEMPFVLDVPKPRRPPAKGPPPPRAHTVQLQFFRDPPPHVKTYVTNACYYANQVSMINRDGSREKRGIVLNDSNIYVMSSGAKVEQTIPLTQVEALIMQDIMTPKSLGISKEWQTHILLQLRDFPDLFFSLPDDKKNDPTTGGTYGEKIPVLEVVLAELLRAYDVDLLVCSLREEESIHHLVKRTVTDAAMRRECDEILAYRTSLTATLNDLMRHDSRLVTNCNEIEVSGASHTATTLLKEIELIEGKNEVMTAALNQANVSLNRCLSKEHELRGSLQAKEKAVQEEVDRRVAAQQGEMIARQALEYELMKVAHQTEMQHLKLLCEFLQARIERCRRSPAVTVADLESYLEELKRLKQSVLSRKAEANKKLAVAKRHLVDSEAALQKVTNEVAVLQKLPPGTPIPPDFNRELAPTFLPVHLPQKQLGDQNAGVDVKAPPHMSSSKKISNAQETAVVLPDDDDDDDICLEKPPTQQPARNQSNIILDDDL